MITSKPIPEQVFQANQPVSLDLSSYFTLTPDEIVIYSIDQFPKGLGIDPNTGVVTGTAINVPINMPFLVSVTITSEETGQSLTEYFPVTIVAAEQASPESAQGLYERILEDSEYLTGELRWQLQQWIQFIIQEHYACVYIYNGEYPPNMFGDKISERIAESGFTIYNYPNYVIVSTGKMSFADGSNQGRLLRTLHEAFNVDVRAKNWSAIGIVATDNMSTSKAWLVGKFLNFPVSEQAPNNEAIFNYRNLAKLRGVSVEPGFQPAPGG